MDAIDDLLGLVPPGMVPEAEGFGMEGYYDPLDDRPFIEKMVRSGNLFSAP
jgi:hypothetical protein